MITKKTLFLLGVALAASFTLSGCGSQGKTQSGPWSLNLPSDMEQVEVTSETYQKAWLGNGTRIQVSDHFNDGIFAKATITELAASARFFNKIEDLEISDSAEITIPGTQNAAFAEFNFTDTEGKKRYGAWIAGCQSSPDACSVIAISTENGKPLDSKWLKSFMDDLTYNG